MSICIIQQVCAPVYSTAFFNFLYGDGVGDGEKMHKEDGTQGVCSSWLGGDDVIDVFCFEFV
jgi:hypothetical protein